MSINGPEIQQSPRNQRDGSWLRRLPRPSFQLSGIYCRDTFVWRAASVGVWGGGGLAAGISAASMPTGLGAWFDIFLSIILYTVLLVFAAVGISAILTLFHVPLPRLFTGGLLSVCTLVTLILYYADLYIVASLIISVIYALAGAITGMLIWKMASLKLTIRRKVVVILTAFMLTGIFLIWFRQAYTSIPTEQQVYDADAFVQNLTAASNPARPGSSDYMSFTYGSGEDRHRNEFGEEATLTSESVDASAYIDKWPRLRKLFWGFDETALPLNGRVWMPEGEGPFPITIMVHGNHLMEDFSDEGYGYLGELLASRGIIAVSIDENFLNYSVWSGIPNQDMKMRAWMILKHLQQISAFNSKSGNHFYGKVDVQRVGLVGHSRGGQAVAMAADRSRFFAADQTLTGLEKLQIKAVVALAPTDKKVDNKSATLKDVYYLALQGARDADVNNFYGDRQYGRASFSPNSERFKTSLYIVDANHSQFNTEWGALDETVPGGLFISRKDVMDAADQREAAKVYVSALLEVALHGNREYIGLFRDYRTGLGWLPSTQYFNRYESAGFHRLAGFDEDRDKTSLQNGGKAEAAGMVLWDEQEAKDRDQNGKGTRSVVLEWEDGGSYALNIPGDNFIRESERRDASLIFSMTNLEKDLDIIENGEVPLPKLEVELQNREGVAVRLPLDRFRPVSHLPRITYTWIPGFGKWMDEGKYVDSTEPVFQTYILPMKSFREANPQFSPANLEKVTFYFVGGPGKIMLDDIGFEYSHFML